MIPLKMSIHKIKSSSTREISFARLVYKSGSTLIQQSIPLERLPVALVNKLNGRS